MSQILMDEVMGDAYSSQLCFENCPKAQNLPVICNDNGLRVTLDDSLNVSQDLTSEILNCANYSTLQNLLNDDADVNGPKLTLNDSLNMSQNLITEVLIGSDPMPCDEKFKFSLMENPNDISLHDSIAQNLSISSHLDLSQSLIGDDVAHHSYDSYGLTPDQSFESISSASEYLPSEDSDNSISEVTRNDTIVLNIQRSPLPNTSTADDPLPTSKHLMAENSEVADLFMDDDPISDTDNTYHPRSSTPLQDTVDDQSNTEIPTQCRKLMDEENLQVIRVSYDGDSFFSATAKQSMDPKISPAEMRQKICDGLLAAEDEIVPFCPYETDTESERREIFRKEVAALREAKSKNHWLSEILPLVAANVLDRPAKIFDTIKDAVIPIVTKDESSEDMTGGNWLYYVLSMPDSHFDFCVVKNVEVIEDSPKEEEDLPAKERSRQRKRKPETWKDRTRKRRRNRGESYVSRNGKKRQARKIGNGCGDRCRMRCQTKFSQEEREEIFESYWALGDATRQRNFLKQHTKECPVQRRRGQQKTKGNGKRRRQRKGKDIQPVDQADEGRQPARLKSPTKEILA
jgi:hypothetical protein